MPNPILPSAVDYSRIRIESQFFTCTHGHKVRFHRFEEVSDVFAFDLRLFR